MELTAWVISIISHWHPDHTGGEQFWEQHTFSTGNRQVRFEGHRANVPSPMSYPGMNPVVAAEPTKIAEGVGLTGVLPFAEIMNTKALFPFLADITTGLPVRNTEQALVVKVAGRELVLNTGCGHPTVLKLVAQAQAAFHAPITGVIGGLHLAGAPDAVVQEDIRLLRSLNVQLVGLSPHDSDAGVMDRFRAAFASACEDVQVGRAIRLAGPTQ